MEKIDSASAGPPQPGPRSARRQRPRVLAAIVGLAVLIGSGVAVALTVRHPVGPAGSAAAQSRPLPPAGQDSLLPGTGVLLGAWVQPAAGLTDASQESAISAFERMIGRKLAIDSLYVGWGDPMPLALARWDLRGGRIPIISWGDVSSARVVAGTYDRQIRKQAAQLKSLHGPVLLRFFPEMNNGFVTSAAGTAATFIAAWRHVYKIFVTAGATNVQWVWCPTSIGFSTGVAQHFYPGEAYVNWIGADGFNWAPGRPGAHWRSFAAIFSAFYDWADRQGRPLLVGEFGTAEGSSRAKANWFRQAGQQLQVLFPRIRAVVYFNSIHENFGYQFDWTVNSSPSALAAFRAIVHNRYFSARPTI